MGPYFRGISRVPCTEVEADDYISGAVRKLEDALEQTLAASNGLVAIVNGPGVSLIGDNCQMIVERLSAKERVILFDADDISAPLSIGFDKAMTRLLDFACRDRSGPETVRGDAVNLLGLNVFVRDWEAAKEDLVDILSTMGIEVLCCPGSGCSMEELRDSVHASCNVVVCKEYCRNQIAFYESIGIPSIDTGMAPVGIDAILDWINTIARHFDRDPLPALEILGRIARRIDKGMMAAMGSGKFAGRSFGIEGDLSIVHPMTEWLHRSLGLVPVYIRLYDGYTESESNSFEKYLDTIGCASALIEELPEKVCVMLCDGNTARKMELGEVCGVGVDIGFPSLYEVDFMAKSPIGHRGAMYVMERIVNSRPLM